MSYTCRCSFRILQLINVCFDNIRWAGASWPSKCVIISHYRPEEIALLTAAVTKHSWVMWFIWAGSGSRFMNRTCVRSGVLMIMWVIIRPFCFTRWHLAVKRSRDAIKAPVVTLESSDRCCCLFWSLISSVRPWAQISLNHTHKHQHH